MFDKIITMFPKDNIIIKRSWPYPMCNNLSPVDELKDDTEKLEQNKNLQTNVKHLILFNDDVNTFEHVTQTLIDVCNHNPLQAEQCTFLVHYVGKCIVKSGSFEKLYPMCEGLLDKGLTAKIE